MRVRVPLVSVAVITGLTMLACGSGPIESYSRKGSWSPTVNDPTTLHGRYTVPPDRSLHSVIVAGIAPDPAAAAAQVREDIEALKTAVSDAPCTIGVRTYAPPVGSYRDSWRASANLVLDIDLTDAGDVLARMDRIDACRAALLPKTTDGNEDVNGDREHQITLHGGALEVDAPEAHLQALLGRRAAQLSAVAEVPNAPQLHPEDYRCVPTGIVSLGDRTLEGVVLTLDLQCRVQVVNDDAPEG